jgi:DoxX-like family
VFTAYLMVTTITILANAAIVVADLRRTDFVMGNSAEVGVPESQLPLLAALKAAGAAGLLIGLLGVQLLGVAAAIGLSLFFTGALVAHVRARVFYNLYFPGIYWLLAIASLALAIAQ